MSLSNKLPSYQAGMLVIVLIGVTLGVLKERTSTTFTAFVHVLYDVGAVLLPDF